MDPHNPQETDYKAERDDVTFTDDGIEVEDEFKPRIARRFLDRRALTQTLI